MPNGHGGYASGTPGATLAVMEENLQEMRIQRDHYRSERDHYVRLFNRLDAAISGHRKRKEGSGFADDEDDSLYEAHDRILKAAAKGSQRELDDNLANMRIGLEAIKQAAIKHGVNDKVGEAIAFAEVLVRKGGSA